MRIHILAAAALAASALACRSTSTGAAGAAGATGAADRPVPFDVDALFRTSALLRPPVDVHAGWLPNPDAAPSRMLIGQLNEGGARQLLAVDPATGLLAAVVDAAAMESALQAAGLDEDAARSASHTTSYAFDTTCARILVEADHGLWVYERTAGTAARVTTDPTDQPADEPEDEPEDEIGAAFSPDGRWVGFVRGGNLFAAASDGAGERALTSDGDSEHLRGRLDWVYQEEIYGRGTWGAFWWSPDSARVAFLSLDETEVPEWSVPHSLGVYPELETLRYPKAGAPNPKVGLHVVELASGVVTDVDLAQWPADCLVVRVGWTPDSSAVAFMVQDRVQTWLDFALADPASGAPRKLLRETSPAWVEPLDGPWWLADGKRFVWLSQRDGWQHAYLYDDQGTLLSRLSEGRFEIDAVHGLDEAGGMLWVSCDRDDPKGAQLYELSLAGVLERVSQGAGTHAISMAPDFRHYVDTHGSATSPTRISLHAADGTLIEELGAVDATPLDEAGLALPELVSLDARDGFPLEGYLIKPPGFSPGGRYPTIVHTYGGPHSPKVVDSWGGFDKLWHQMLARHGLLVFVVDPRAASGRGLESAATAYKRLGQGELADLEDAVRWLVDQGHADAARIGLWGWSYGGYLTAYAMTHSELFAAGVIGAPVTDWRLYDSIYTERLMDLPSANPDGYEAAAVMPKAADLHGYPLIIYGTIDENVHPQNALQLVEALQKAGKEFAVMPYPESRHGVVEPAQRRHLYRTMAEFFLERL